MYFADAWVAKRATKTSSTKATAFEGRAARDMLSGGCRMLLKSGKESRKQMTGGLFLKALSGNGVVRRGSSLAVVSGGAQKQKGRVSGRSFNSEEESRPANF
jgi:hypothetical protein